MLYSVQENGAGTRISRGQILYGELIDDLTESLEEGHDKEMLRQRSE